MADINQLYSDIERFRRQEAEYANDASAAGQEQLRIARDQLVLLRQQRDVQNQQLNTTQTYVKEYSTFAKSYAKLSSSVKSQLQTQSSLNTQTSVYKALAEDIAKSKAREATLTGENLENEQERGALMTEMNASYLMQAKATAKAIDDAAGLTEFDKMRRDLKETMLELSDEERQRLEDTISATEKLYQKQQRINAIQEEKKGLYEAIPEGLKEGIGFAQKLGSTLMTAGAGAAAFILLAGVITAAISSFTALDSAAKEFRETTGLTNSQMEGIKSDANEIVGEFRAAGVEAKNVFDTVASLKSEFSDSTDFSKETVEALTLMNTNFGVAAEDAAKVQGIMEQVGGLSSETASNVGMQVINLAKAAKVAPAKVMKDMAENAEAASTFFKGNVELLTQQAVEARRLGTNLSAVTKTAERLLDFEGSIEDELVASTFVSGQFNLSKARELAIQGDLVGAQKETLKQIQRSGDFRKQDYHTQLQLAKASNMSVEEINKQLDAQDKLSSLTEEQRLEAEKAIEAGLDITNIDKDQLALETEKFAKQQEQQATLEKIQNQFMGMVATVGSQLVPIFETIIPILGLILEPIGAIAGVIGSMTSQLGTFVSYLAESEPFMSTLLGIATAIAVQKGYAYYFTAAEGAQTKAQIITKRIQAGIEFLINKRKEQGLLMTIREAAMRAFSSFAGIPGIGIALAVGAAAAALAYGMGLFKKAGDVYSPADGVTRVSTKEGGLYELSPNDDLVAAPGAAAALANAGGDGGGTTLNVDLSTLSAPLNAMINEIKALRADMASGKIAVYMDTAKVTSNIGRQVDAGTRNNYTLGQA